VIFPEILGHERTRAVLSRLLASDRVPHAFLFHGPEGVGKGLVARLFAVSLVCTQPGQDGAGCGSCGACRKALELKLKAAQESHRACPVDGAVMTKEVAYMMVIDRCPACHGVWLDAEEMDHLTGDVAREAMMAIARGIPLDAMAASPGVRLIRLAMIER